MRAALPLVLVVVVGAVLFALLRDGDAPRQPTSVGESARSQRTKAQPETPIVLPASPRQEQANATPSTPTVGQITGRVLCGDASAQVRLIAVQPQRRSQTAYVNTQTGVFEFASVKPGTKQLQAHWSDRAGLHVVSCPDFEIRAGETVEKTLSSSLSVGERLTVFIDAHDTRGNALDVPFVALHILTGDDVFSGSMEAPINKPFVLHGLPCGDVWLRAEVPSAMRKSLPNRSLPRSSDPVTVKVPETKKATLRLTKVATTVTVRMKHPAGNAGKAVAVNLFNRTSIKDSPMPQFRLSAATSSEVSVSVKPGLYDVVVTGVDANLYGRLNGIEVGRSGATRVVTLTEGAIVRGTYQSERGWGGVQFGFGPYCEGPATSWTMLPGVGCKADRSFELRGMPPNAQLRSRHHTDVRTGPPGSVTTVTLRDKKR